MFFHSITCPYSGPCKGMFCLLLDLSQIVHSNLDFHARPSDLSVSVIAKCYGDSLLCVGPTGNPSPMQLSRELNSKGRQDPSLYHRTLKGARKRKLPVHSRPIGILGFKSQPDPKISWAIFSPLWVDL